VEFGYNQVSWSNSDGDGADRGYIWIGRMDFVIHGRVSSEEGHLIACVAAYSPFPILSCTLFRLRGYPGHTRLVGVFVT